MSKYLNYDKWYNHYVNMAKALLENSHQEGVTASFKEKYGRVDITEHGNRSDIIFEKLRDFEDMSENSCQYCVRHRRQVWFEHNGWLRHLCIPCYLKYLPSKILGCLKRFIRKLKQMID